MKKPVQRKKSFLTCPHRNIQQFTERCLECGFNIHTTKKEYLAHLRAEYQLPATAPEVKLAEGMEKINSARAELKKREQRLNATFEGRVLTEIRKLENKVGIVR